MAAAQSSATQSATVQSSVTRPSASHQALEIARQARDPRFDGRFFIGVTTTGIYCRPVCRVRLPKPENVEFYPSAAAAGAAGFRPCMRCRPEAAPGTPAWSGTSTTVSRGLKLISEGALDQAGVESLSARLGVTSRHLSRLFRQHLGASPIAVAQTRRLQTARTLLDQTPLEITQIALLAGYGSVRRFNAHFLQVYQRPPSALRRSASEVTTEGFNLRLAYRPPFDFAGILAFLAMRGIPGVEQVDDKSYSRAIMVDGQPGFFTVTNDSQAHTLVCSIKLANPAGLMRVGQRIKALFDLNADPLDVNQCLQQDPLLAPLVAANPGQRVPGGWDPFEIAVRAIVGQQISVKGATTVMGRLARDYGSVVAGVQYFPTPAQLAELVPADMPMPQARARAIQALALAVANGEIDFAAFNDADELIDVLTRIKGIGGWTARYVAMRALNDPDAFLHDDLVLVRVARQHFGLADSQALLAHSLRWQPWRAYAGMHLWRYSATVATAETAVANAPKPIRKDQ
jgi:AraC family transcriptional regulator of adaptative response / DNA-3-methyladenine glycosylase II